MINGERLLAVIAARGGSKRVPGKNIKLVAGRPLIAWTIEVARAISRIDRLVLSSDDEAIIAVAREWGCEAPFVRDAGLASDTAGSVDTVLNALANVGDYEWVLLLQPTSPLRVAEDIEGVLNLAERSGAPSVVSVCRAPKHLSRHYVAEPDHGRLRSITKLVALPAWVDADDEPLILNGAIYLVRSDWLRERRSFSDEDTIAYEMPRLRSIDIDEAAELTMAEALLNQRANGGLC